MSEIYDKTPLKIFKKKHLIGKDSVTPLKIPGSPFLEKLGLGTGIEVLKISRSPRNNTVRSPWAIKRIAKRCMARDAEQNGIYSSRLTSEAELLKKLNHANIIGFRALKQLNDGRECIAMELCNISLGNLLETRLEDTLGPLPAKNILKVTNFRLDSNPVYIKNSTFFVDWSGHIKSLRVSTQRSSDPPRGHEIPQHSDQEQL